MSKELEKTILNQEILAAIRNRLATAFNKVAASDRNSRYSTMSLDLIIADSDLILEQKEKELEELKESVYAEGAGLIAMLNRVEEPSSPDNRLT